MSESEVWTALNTLGACMEGLQHSPRRYNPRASLGVERRAIAASPRPAPRHCQAARRDPGGGSAALAAPPPCRRSNAASPSACRASRVEPHAAAGRARTCRESGRWEAERREDRREPDAEVARPLSWSEARRPARCAAGTSPRSTPRRPTRRERKKLPRTRAPAAAGGGSPPPPPPPTIGGRGAQR